MQDEKFKRGDHLEGTRASGDTVKGVVTDITYFNHDIQYGLITPSNQLRYVPHRTAKKVEK